MNRINALLIGATLVASALNYAAAPPAAAFQQQRIGVAFTFDDGLSARGIREILAVAVAQRVPVTFFPTAQSLRKFPQLWREISNAGFAIGNHTAGHQSLTALLLANGPAAVRDAITEWQVVATELGISTIPFLRPPFGERSEATDQIAASVGITHVVNWGATFADTAPRCSGTIAKRIAHATSGGDGVTVLAHTGAAGRGYEPLSARIFADVINAYRVRGIRPVSLDTMYGAPKRIIDWTQAAIATSAPAKLGQPRVPTKVPRPYSAAELNLSPGAAAGVCG